MQLEYAFFSYENREIYIVCNFEKRKKKKLAMDCPQIKEHIASSRSVSSNAPIAFHVKKRAAIFLSSFIYKNSTINCRIGYPLGKVE